MVPSSLEVEQEGLSLAAEHMVTMDESIPKDYPKMMQTLVENHHQAKNLGTCGYEIVQGHQENRPQSLICLPHEILDRIFDFVDDYFDFRVGYNDGFPNNVCKALLHWARRSGFRKVRIRSGTLHQFLALMRHRPDLATHVEHINFYYVDEVSDCSSQDFTVFPRLQKLEVFSKSTSIFRNLFMDPSFAKLKFPSLFTLQIEFPGFSEVVDPFDPVRWRPILSSHDTLKTLEIRLRGSYLPPTPTTIVDADEIRGRREGESSSADRYPSPSLFPRSNIRRLTIVGSSELPLTTAPFMSLFTSLESLSLEDKLGRNGFDRDRETILDQVSPDLKKLEVGTMRDWRGRYSEVDAGRRPILIPFRRFLSLEELTIGAGVACDETFFSKLAMSTLPGSKVAEERGRGLERTTGSPMIQKLSFLPSSFIHGPALCIYLHKITDVALSSLKEIKVDSVGGKRGRKLMDRGGIPYLHQNQGEYLSRYSPYPDWVLPTWTDHFKIQDAEELKRITTEKGIKLTGEIHEAIAIAKEYEVELEQVKEYERRGSDSSASRFFPETTFSG